MPLVSFINEWPALWRLPNARLRVSTLRLMRLIRSTLAVFLTLSFVVATNRCAIAAAFPEVEKCCEEERAPGDSDRGSPCDGKDCASCATLESGVHLASLVPLTIVTPVWTDAEDFAELMRRLAVAAVEDALAPPPDPAEMPSPPWCDVMSKALPVRGPSLVG